MKAFSKYVVAGVLMAVLLGGRQGIAAEKPQFSGFLHDYSSRKFDPTRTWGQVEQRIDYWSQWVVTQIQTLHGKVGA